MLLSEESMSDTKNKNIPNEKIDINFGDEAIASKKRKIYHAVFDGVQMELESFDSFSLKFGLLTNMPVNKVKHMIMKTPASIWSGPVKSKAAGLVHLIEEAGGIGRLVEEEKEEASRYGAGGRSAGKKSSVCPKCGFPLKKEDDFCQFCMTPMGEEKKEVNRYQFMGRKSSVPLPRLLFYLLVLFAAVVITVAAKMQ